MTPLRANNCLRHQALAEAFELDPLFHQPPEFSHSACSAEEYPAYGNAIAQDQAAVGARRTVYLHSGSDLASILWYLPNGNERNVQAL